MGMEIERKFLVSSDLWRVGTLPVRYAQGYLSKDTIRTVRIRIAGTKGYLTIKGPVSGISRSEFEYPIPLEDAQQLLDLCIGPIVKKNRHKILFEGHLWEVDEFLGENQGLIMAEVELSHPEESIILPPWIGREVSGDSRYYNSNLNTNPYQEWVRDSS